MLPVESFRALSNGGLDRVAVNPTHYFSMN
mgnify:FL=1|jgi:hypothetical protein